MVSFFRLRLAAVVVLAAPLGLHAAASPARAAELGPEVKIGVLDVRTAGSVDPASVAALLSLIASEATHSQATVVSGADLQALIGLETQKQLAGCGDGSCLAQVGGALGVDYLLVSEVGEVGGRWLLTTTLLDVTKATALRRVTKVAKTVGELVDVAGAAVAETVAVLAPVAPAPAAASPATTTAGAAAPTGPAVSTPGVEPTPSASRRGPMRLVGSSALGVGGIALLSGVVAGVLARREHDRALSSPPASSAALAAKRASIRKKLWIADGSFIGAVVAAGVGAALLLTAPQADAPSPAAVSLGIAPTPGGAAFVLTGGF
jgi:hypothetical protein